MKQLFLLIVFLISHTLLSQKTLQEKTKRTTEQKAQTMIQKITGILNLNKNQIIKIAAAINTEYQNHKKMSSEKRTLRTQQDFTTEEKFKFKKDASKSAKSLDLKINEILNSEQYLIWKEIYQLHKEKVKKDHVRKKKKRNLKES